MDKQKIQGESNENGQQTPYVIFNTGILDPSQHENNSLYDPNFISNYYSGPNDQMQQQQQMEQNYINNMQNMYDSQNHNPGEQQQPQEIKRNEGDEVFDPFGIREEIKGDTSDDRKAEKQRQHEKQNPQFDKQNPQFDKQYSEIDYDKYISKNFSNFQPTGKKRGKPRRTDPSNMDYDKEEINMSVNQYYASMGGESDKRGSVDKSKIEESKFEEPMAKNRKRRNRFEDAPNNS
jgi:hypothetical protein